MYYITDSSGSVLGKVDFTNGKVYLNKSHSNLQDTLNKKFDKLSAIETIMSDMYDDSYTPQQRFADIKRVLKQ